MEKFILVDNNKITILLEKSSKAKRINISIRSEDKVRVAVPKYATFNQGEDIINKEIKWIEKSIRDYKTKKNISQNLYIRNLNKDESKKLITNRLDLLSRKYNLSYNRVFIKSQKTLWGSCSIRNNINLNINLAKLPDNLINYVIIHELVHTIHKNHGKMFWNEVGRIIPEYKSIRKVMKSLKI